MKEENATMNIQRLNVRIDQTEEDLLNEKLKIKVKFFCFFFLRQNYEIMFNIVPIKL